MLSLGYVQCCETQEVCVPVSESGQSWEEESGEGFMEEVMRPEY